MKLWILLGALALNMTVGRFFKPYTPWAVSLNVRIANFFGKKDFKHGKRWGTALVLFLFAAIWAGVDVLIMVAQYQSVIYSYIAYGLATFFFVQCGQVSAVSSKFRGQIQNAPYLKQLFGALLVKDPEKIEPTRYNKAFIYAYAEMLARRVVLPMIIIVFFGVGLAAAYMFVDTVAASDRSKDIKSHSFADFAVRFSKWLSWPGYFVFSVILWAIGWVTGRQKAFAKKPFAERCYLRLFNYCGEEFSENTFATAGFLPYFVTVLNALVIIAVFIFIEAVLAALGLDEYWDFWSGKNIIREE